MKKDDYRFPTALTKVMCPVCTKTYDSDIVIATRATTTPEGQHDVDKMHGKVTDYMDKPCSECMAAIGGAESGNVYIIGIDAVKSGNDIYSVFRTGNVYGVTNDYIHRLFDNAPKQLSFAKKHRFVFVDYLFLKTLGFPDIVYKP